MEKFSKAELEEAVAALTSLISKCEKAKLKLADGTPQRTTLDKRLKAFKMALEVLGDLLSKIQ